jgi:FtsZ-interacting cell division protein YlmF
VQTFFCERRYVRYFVVQAEEKEDEEMQEQQRGEQQQGEQQESER